MVGRRFGRLVVLRDSGIRKHRAVYWECVCDCGKMIITRSSNLTSGNTQSCGCLLIEARHNKKQLNKRKPNSAPTEKIGMVFNMLTIIDVEQELRKPTMAVCKCECGNIVKRPYKEVVKYSIKSCGCLKREISVRAKLRKEQKLQEKLNANPNEFKPHKDFSSKKFGKLSALYFCGVNIDKKGAKHSLWYCKCDCGAEVIKKSDSFKTRNMSCGCVYRENRRKRAKILAKKRNNELSKLIAKGSPELNNDTHKHRRLSVTVRNAVFNKYGDRCIICGKEHNKEEPLCIHHLKPHWRYPKLRYFTINNIPLCRDCHDKLHKQFGYTHIPPVMEQMEYVAKHRQKHGVNV